MDQSESENYMKNFLLVLLLLIPCSVFSQTTPTMTKEERDKAIKLLLDSQKETMDFVTALSDAQWNYKPAPEKWSAGEVAERRHRRETLVGAGHLRSAQCAAGAAGQSDCAQQ